MVSSRIRSASFSSHAWSSAAALERFFRSCSLSLANGRTAVNDEVEEVTSVLLSEPFPWNDAGATCVSCCLRRRARNPITHTTTSTTTTTAPAAPAMTPTELLAPSALAMLVVGTPGGGDADGAEADDAC